MTESTWPKYTITGILGIIAGIFSTHNVHGTKIAALEVQLNIVSTQLDRIEQSVRDLSKK